MVTHAALPAQQIKTVELKYKLLHIPAMEPAQATMGWPAKEARAEGTRATVLKSVGECNSALSSAFLSGWQRPYALKWFSKILFWQDRPSYQCSQRIQSQMLVSNVFCKYVFSLLSSSSIDFMKQVSMACLFTQLLKLHNENPTTHHIALQISRPNFVISNNNNNDSLYCALVVWPGIRPKQSW